MVLKVEWGIGWWWVMGMEVYGVVDLFYVGLVWFGLVGLDYIIFGFFYGGDL